MASAGNYRFVHVTGSYTADAHGSIVADTADAKLPPLPKERYPEVLKALKTRVRKEAFVAKNTKRTRSAIKSYGYSDILIIHAAHSLEELDRAVNLLGRRLREWFAITLPELAEEITAAETLAHRIIGSPRSELLASLSLTEETTLGTPLQENEYAALKALAERIAGLAGLRTTEEGYIKEAMGRLYPNFTRVAGAAVGARLLAHAGSFSAIVRMTASKLQMLGAEKALFRHMRTKAPPPKHGLISQHPLVSGAKRGEKGRAARMLADKLVIAARVDYFKGEFIGDRLYEELEGKLCHG